MEPEQFEEILRDVLADRENIDQRIVMPIAAFQAEDMEGVDVEVVGVTYLQSDNENLSFVVMVELEGGEIIPSIRDGVWRKSDERVDSDCRDFHPKRNSHYHC